MPGLSQLKQFDKDILSLGDEVSLRAARGEKPVIVPIPKTIKDVDDSEEFVMGMPEIEAIVQDNSADEDLSDLAEIAGLSTPAQKKEEVEAPSFQAPDLSSLLAPIGSDDSNSGMPDLSDFLEPEEPEIVEEEAEPEPPSIADMSLDDLLGGEGFDGSSVEEFSTDNDTTPDTDLEEFYSGGFGDENYVPKKREPPTPSFMQLKQDDTSSSLGDANIEDLGLEDVLESEPAEEQNLGDALSLEELGLGSLDNTADTTAEDLGSGLDAEDAQDIEDLGGLDDLGEMPAMDDLGADLGEMPAMDEVTEPAAEEQPAPIEDMDFSMPDDLGADLGEMPAMDDLGADIGDMPAMDEVTEPTTDIGGDLSGLDDLGDMPAMDDLGADLGETPAMDDLGADLGEMPAMDEVTEPAAEEQPTPIEDMDFSMPDDLGADLGEMPAMDEVTEPAADIGGDLSGLDDLGEMPAMDDLGADLGDMPSIDEFAEPSDTSEENPDLTDGFGSDFGAAAGLDDMDALGDISEAAPAIDDAPVDETPTSETPIDDFAESTETQPVSIENMDFSMPDDMGETPDSSEEVPDFGFGELANDLDSELEQEDIPIEDFDTSEMDGINFDIPETDAQISPEEAGFEFGQGDDFAIEGQEFEIPGYSDVETAKEDLRSGPLLTSSSKKGSKKAEDEEDLPPNTLSDSQYKQFLKNLSDYPLNVRLAFEDLIVKNEFTDEAEFEIIEKILNKSSARSVASMLEKMLDISIPVPRDYEHRTAEEYEAYKKSLQYQLKNKIIPGVFACMLMLVVGFGLFQFGKNCIYNPAKANSLYKQGYAMLEADEYPQSEINYNEAKKYKLSRNWSFKYARGYRAHKQYLRAEWMYQNILNDFKHDKEAGLEYAEMELNDLANYERAEEICRREILDYHINDKDGILLLGDVFLEWGTEKDPEMLEKAREQYATLIQLYKSNMLYESRMMRYFIRTDSLRNVLQLKQKFIPKEKNLSAEDWTELAGYLMDKLYGPLSPSEEYLRTEIEDVRLMLMRAVKLDPKNPIATYNLSRYFIETNEPNAAKDSLVLTIDNFKNSSMLKKRDIYKYIDSYRLLGEQYSKAQEYLRAQEYYTDGISLYTAERDASGFPGTKQIGVLFADQANIDYFISGDFDNALQNYTSSVELENDNPSIRYKIGYIQYKKKNYAEALGSFMKAGDGNIKETNLLLAMANTLSLRGDNYAAQGYYEDLISNLDKQIADKGIVLPQTSQDDNDIVTTYLYAANNYGVTLYRLASRTGNSAFNAEAIVQLSQSVRAWDALTRNQETLVRLGGSNLAEENIKYITHPIPDFEPAIYTEIPRILINSERF